MKWEKTDFTGVRYRKHPTRKQDGKHGVKKDMYFAIRYQRDGIRKEEGLGCVLIVLFIAKCAKVQQPRLESAEAYYNRGNAYYKKKEYDNAWDDINKHTI